MQYWIMTLLHALMEAKGFNIGMSSYLAAASKWINEF